MIGTVRLTKSEAAALKQRYGSIARGLRHALQTQRKVEDAQLVLLRSDPDPDHY